MILKIQGKFSEIFWNWRNPKKVFGAHYKIILELHGHHGVRRETLEWKRNSPKMRNMAGKARRTIVAISPERKLYTTNFGEGCKELLATARDKSCTSKTSASRATPAYIYI
jgi:hypothetical protein